MEGKSEPSFIELVSFRGTVFIFVLNVLPFVKLAAALRPPWVGVTFVSVTRLLWVLLGVSLGDLTLTHDYIILNNWTLFFWKLLVCAGSRF